MWNCAKITPSSVLILGELVLLRTKLRSKCDVETGTIKQLLYRDKNLSNVSLQYAFGANFHYLVCARLFFFGP